VNDWFYIWDTHGPFGWAALCGSAAGARRFDFGYRSREQCLARARLFEHETPARIIKSRRTVTHPGPQKGPVWLFPATVSLTRVLLGDDAPLGHIPLDWAGHTEFRKAVWRAAMQIPRGQTRSYAWIAARAGSPGAARAAGGALGANPLPLIVPCHRIINSCGGIGGFGMGLDLKRRLLAMEGVLT